MIKRAVPNQSISLYLRHGVSVKLWHLLHLVVVHAEQYRPSFLHHKNYGATPDVLWLFYHPYLQDNSQFFLSNLSFLLRQSIRVWMHWNPNAHLKMVLCESGVTMQGRACNPVRLHRVAATSHTHSVTNSSCRLAGNFEMDKGSNTSTLTPSENCLSQAPQQCWEGYF